MMKWWFSPLVCYYVFRSIAAFAGMCDGAVNDMEGAASADDTTINAIDIVSSFYIIKW